MLACITIISKIQAVLSRKVKIGKGTCPCLPDTNYDFNYKKNEKVGTSWNSVSHGSSIIMRKQFNSLCFNHPGQPWKLKSRRTSIKFFHMADDISLLYGSQKAPESLFMLCEVVEKASDIFSGSTFFGQTFPTGCHLIQWYTTAQI